MPIRFRCKCGKIVKVDEQYAGREATCPNCGTQLIVPSVSTASGAGAPEAKAASPTQPSQSPASELELESEPSPAGGKADDAVGNVMELESEPASPGSAAADTVEEVADVEEVAPESEVSEVVELPDDSAAALSQAAPPEAAGERVCPNCGAAAPPTAATCAECGANLMPEKAPAKKASRLVKAYRSVREHEAFPLIAIIAAVVVILTVTVVILHARKSKKPSITAGAAIRAAQMAHGSEAAPAPKAAPASQASEKPAPPPASKVSWAGFSDPALIARDRLQKIGEEFAAFVDKNHQPPATLAEAGMAEAESAEYSYVGAEIAALPRFLVTVYEAKASESYEPYVLFSDGSARQVAAAQVPSALLKKTESGWVTAADAALLAQTAPVIRVTNLRFASLEVALDDKPAGVAPRGGVCVIPAAAGSHQITLTAGGQKETFQADLKPGVVYAYVHPWQADLAWIPMRQYRSALMAQPVVPPLPGVPAAPPAQTPKPSPQLPKAPPLQPLPYAIDRKENYAVKTLKGPDEIVDFLDGDGRTALASDLSSIAARITREKENLTIEGLPPDKLILVNEIGRMEAGVVRFNGDITVTFRKTALGVLRCEELPNTGPAAISLPEAEQGQAPASQPGATPRWVHKATTATRGGRPAPVRPRNLMRDQQEGGVTAAQGGPAAAAEAPPPPPQLAFPTTTFMLLPDCEALAAALSSAAPAAVELLLQRAQVEPIVPEVAPATGRGMPPRGAGRPPAGAGGAPVRRLLRNDNQQGATPRPQPEGRGAAAAKVVEVVERPLRAEEIPPPLVYAGLALYGDSSAFRVLAAECEKTPVESPAYPPLLLALARSGGISALAYLRTASDSAPTSAVIALCTIDDPAARSALDEILANWTPNDVAEAVDEWPVVAGPTCRIAFVETLASVNPALLDDLTVLNALMKLEPFALEQALAAHLEAEFNAPTPPPAAATAPSSAAQPPAKGRRRARPAPYTGPRSAAARAAAASPAEALALRSAAPLSWIALARFKNTAAVTRFVQLLGDRDSTKRLRAAAALGEVRDPDIVTLLIPLLQDRDVAMRRAAARALVQMPDAAVVRALDAAMDKNLLVSAIVEQAPALAAKAGTEATAALLAKMLTAAAKVKAPVAASPLDEEGRARPRPAAKAEESDAATPMMLIEALNHLGLYSPEVKTALEAAREAFDPAVRAAAYQAREQAIAGADAAERSTSALAAAALALKDPEGSVRCAGIGLLSAADPAAALSLLLPALKDPEADVRAAVLSALPIIPDDPRIAAAITASLSAPSPAVVSAAARAAARRHDPALGAAVLAALNQAGIKAAEPAAGSNPANPTRGRPAAPAGGKPAEQSAVLASLAEAAADLQPEGAAGALANLLACPEPDVRAAAARALGKLKDATALNSLLSGLQDKDPSVVSAAIGALGESDAPEAIQAVLDALAKETLTPELRQQILERLAAHCGDATSAYGSWALNGPALKDADLDILVSMAPAAPAAERPGLIVLAGRYLAEPRPEAKKDAATILANYADDEGVRATLLKALEQDDTGVVPAAADVLRRIRDDSMIDVPLVAYYKALCEGSNGPAGSVVTVAPPPTPATRAGPGPGMGMPGRRGRGGETAPITPPPATAALPPLGPQFPGLAKATAAESVLLRAAIIEALGSIGGEHAGKALRTIVELEQKINSDDVAPNLIAAFERAKAPNSVRDLCQFYVIPAGRYRLAAISALTRMVSLDPERVTETLQRLVGSGLTPSDVAAAAADALDEIRSAGGA